MITYEFVTNADYIPWHPPIGIWPNHYSLIYESKKIGKVLLAGRDIKAHPSLPTYREHEIDMIKILPCFKNEHCLKMLNLVKKEFPGAYLERVEPTHRY